MTRFRRTKDELARGLTPEQAQYERLSAAADKAPSHADHMDLSARAVKALSKPKPEVKSGDIIIRIRPDKTVDKDYFEHLCGKEIDVTQDDHFYKWIDHFLGKDEELPKLFQDILDKGIGEVIDNNGRYR